MSTYKVSAEGIVNSDTHADTNRLLVKIWDLGPDAPEPPAKPELPKGKEGSPEHDLALIDFKADLAKYEDGLKAFGQAKKDFTAWHTTYEGPYQIEMYSVDAREAIQIAPDRYVIELPKGRKAGKWHIEEQQRQKAAQRSFARTVASDPIFGSQGAMS